MTEEASSFSPRGARGQFPETLFFLRSAAQNKKLSPVDPKAMLKAVVIGSSTALLLQLLAAIPLELEPVNILKTLSSYLLTPGVAACMFLNAGSIENVSFVLMLIFNGVFYSGVAFVFRRWRGP